MSAHHSGQAKFQPAPAELPTSVRDAGQAVVETAIVMPLFVFILLGILQLSLMHQARLMTKYAAFKAARAGSIGNVKMDRMTKAALAVLMPFISEERDATHGTFKIYKARSGSDFKDSWKKISENKQPEKGSLKHVEVMVCGPTKEILTGGGKEFSFDDPKTSTGDDWKPFDRTRLAVQVTFNFRMVIPFANMMLWNLSFGQDKADTLWLTRTGTKALPVNQNLKDEMNEKGLKDLASQGVYVFPIRASWGMRMHSDIFPDAQGYEIPQTNKCPVPFPKEGQAPASGSMGSGGDEDDPGDDG